MESEEEWIEFLHRQSLWRGNWKMQPELAACAAHVNKPNSDHT